MRVMDGIMAIPGIIIAIATISVARGHRSPPWCSLLLFTMFRAVSRLVRSAMLSMREEPYVEAAVILGSPSWSIVLRHMLPGILAPLAVLGTYIAANAMLLEATLSFLGCAYLQTSRPGKHHGRRDDSCFGSHRGSFCFPV